MEISALGGAGQDIDILRNVACLEATKIHLAAIVISVTGLAGSASHCIAVSNRTGLITTDPQPSTIAQIGVPQSGLN